MVERRTCSFCGEDIEPGTGKMYIKKDGTIFYFCTNKCQKNLIKLKRIPRRTRWTKDYMKEKSTLLKALEKEDKKETKKKKVKKGKKVEKEKDEDEEG